MFKAIFEGDDRFYWVLDVAFVVVAVVHTLILRSTLRKIERSRIDTGLPLDFNAHPTTPPRESLKNGTAAVSRIR